MRLLLAIVILVSVLASIARAAESDNYCLNPSAGQPSPWQPCNANNPLVTSTVISPSANVGIAPVVAGSASSSSVLKASAGNLYGVYASCTAACWLMVFNATSAPVDGSTTAGTASGNLQDCVAVPAGGSTAINYAPGPPEVFSVGITAVISSTSCATKTASGVGFIHGSVQ